MTTTFGLVGDGRQAQYHRKAIRHLGGELLWVQDSDPRKWQGEKQRVDFAVICTPSDTHRWYCQVLLESLADEVIVEKPMCLPWEPLIDDDRINIVLQYRYAPLPEKAEKVEVVMVRDHAYFDTWKGNARATGGIFYNLFIHYIDLAARLNADFHGKVVSEGTQVRKVDDINLFGFDMQELYNTMYENILYGDGIHVRDIFYLHWLMNWYSQRNGFGKNAMDMDITIGRELL